MIETLDKGVGRILEKIDALDLASNTIVVFFSDNGGSMEASQQTPLRGAKTTLYEGGIRVPFIVRWPAKIGAGSISRELMISNDLFPTLLEAVGGRVVYDDIDGLSLLPVLKGSPTLTRKALFWHYPHYYSEGDVGGPSGAIRRGDYKLIEWYERSLLEQDNPIELYNLALDIGETDNLVSKEPERARELRNELHEWLLRVGAKMPVLRK
jgi:arylsulfatase A-like enzyme